MSALVPYPKAMAQYPTVRQSLLASFDRCALSTAMSLEYEEGWSTHPQARGQMSHRVFAKCLTEMYERGEDHIPTDVATAILLECLRQHDVEPRDVVNLPMDEVKDLRWTVVKWAHDNRFDIADLVDVEQRLQTTVEYPDPAGGTIKRIITGQLDALFITGEAADQAVVIDWKDTWDLPGPTEVSFGGYFQQRMYALLVLRNYPSVNSVTLREFYVRRSETRDATLWRSDLEALEAEMAALIERFDRAIEHGEVPWSKQAKALLAEMRAARRDGDLTRARDARVAYENLVGLWGPSPGQHCGYCPRPTACPIFPTARGAGRVSSQEDAERVAAETLVAEAAAKKGKEALKVWASKHGAIPIKDAKGVRVFGYQESQRTASPKPEEVQAEIEEAYAQRRAPDVAKLWKTSTGTRFTAHMPKPRSDEGAEDDLAELLERSLAEAQARKAAAG